ncbi:MAG: hypothetical protein JW384_01421 [Nitrosomonadaceae bacterium]|nr:hypothetical protein [Nitrosomonadaceae bacterium]
MTIPTWYIGRVKARQGLTLDDDVLQDFIDCMPDMDISIGIGRTVVQYKFGPSFADFADLLIKFPFLPILKHDRLTLS